MKTAPRVCCVICILLTCVAAMPPSPALASDSTWNPDAELARIQIAIEQNGWDWTARHTPVSDLSPGQKQQMLGGRYDEASWMEGSSGSILPENPRDLPASLDWRTLGGMTGVRNQGGCGSCWCFGTTAAFESMIKIYAGQTTDLSEQQALVCSEGSLGCQGGYASSVANMQATMGQVAESCMPYSGNDAAACVDDECDSVDHIKGYIAVANDPTALKTALLTGPLAVCLYAPDALFWYGGGCFSYSGTGPINHLVCLCGWDDSKCSGQGAWLIKNSWGAGWGEGGYGWIRYGDLDLGYGAVLLDYTPQPVRLGYDSVEVVDGGNHALDAGETAQLRVTLRNYGRNNATGITAYLSTTTPGVTIVDGTATLPDIPVQGRGTTLDPNFTVRLAPDASGAIQFDLTINCTQLANQASGFPMLIGETEAFYTADFESGDQGWTHGGTGDDFRRAALSGTKPGKPDPRSAARGTYAFGNDLNETGSQWNTLYGPLEDCWLQSPVIDCSNREHVYLAFRRWLTAQRRPSDYVRLFVGGTETWGNPTMVPFVDDEWKEVLYDISAIADGNPALTIKFALKSSGSIEYGGWNIDDVRLIVPRGNPTAVENNTASSGLELTSYPNPFNPIVNIRLRLPQEGDPSIRIYDATGRMVRTFDLGHRGIGFHRIVWNGADEQGHVLPGGMYFAKVSLGGREVQSRVVMLK